MSWTVCLLLDIVKKKFSIRVSPFHLRANTFTLQLSLCFILSFNSRVQHKRIGGFFGWFFEAFVHDFPCIPTVLSLWELYRVATSTEQWRSYRGSRVYFFMIWV